MQIMAMLAMDMFLWKINFEMQNLKLSHIISILNGKLNTENKTYIDYKFNMYISDFSRIRYLASSQLIPRLSL